MPYIGFGDEQVKMRCQVQLSSCNCVIFIQDEVTNEVTDMFSFYQLPSTVVDHSRYKSLKAAYSFYNVASSTKLVDLMNDALVIARDVGSFNIFYFL